MTGDLGLKIARNSVYNFLRTFINIPITLAIIPYTVKHLGKEDFAIWALVGVISSYARLSDFGITESLIKFFAEHKERNDARRMNQLINTSISVYLLLSALCYTLMVIILPFIVDKVLNIPPELQSKALYVFNLAIALFFINLSLSVFSSLIIGFLRAEFSNMIALISSLLTAVGTFFFIHQGYGLAGLVYNNAIVTVFVVTANIIAAKHLFPRMQINLITHFSKETLKQIFGFSWKIQLTNITQLMIFQIDRVLLSHYVGLNAVSNYEIANRVSLQAMSFIASIFRPLVPAASSLQAASKNESMAGLYRRSFKYMSLLSIFISFLIIALAHPFVRTWMGPGYETSAFTMQLLTAVYMITLLTGPGVFILNGMNKPHISMRSSIMAGMTNLILCLALVQWFGYYGIIIGISFSIISSGIYFLWMVHRNVPGLSWSVYRQTLAWPIAISIVLSSLLLIINMLFHLQGYFMLFGFGVLYFIIAAIFIMQSSFFDDFDRAILAKLIPLRWINFSRN